MIGTRHRRRTASQPPAVITAYGVTRLGVHGDAMRSDRVRVGPRLLAMYTRSSAPPATFPNPLRYTTGTILLLKRFAADLRAGGAHPFSGATTSLSPESH